MKLPPNHIEFEHQGHSMSPILCNGDTAIVKWFAESKELIELSFGEVVVFSDGSEWVAHRFLGVTSSGALVKGDNSSQVDCLQNQKIAGVVVGVKRKGKCKLWGEKNKKNYLFAKISFYFSRNKYLEKINRKVIKNLIFLK